jgi:hypothetical protein
MRQDPSGRPEGELERPGDGVRQPLDSLLDSRLDLRPVSLLVNRLHHQPDSLLVSRHRPDSLLYSLLHQRPDNRVELERGYEGHHNLIR